MRSLLAVAVYFFGVLAQPAIAALVIDAITPTRAEDFDSLAGVGDLVEWGNDSTLLGWSLFRVTSSGSGSDPVESYQVSDGGHNSGRFYSYGITSTERALGSVGNGNFGGVNPDVTIGIFPGDVAGWIAVSFINDMGTELNHFTMHYDGEQWRDGGNDPPSSQTMEFEYGIGSTFGSVMTWHKPGASFNFVSLQNTIVAGALDGNQDDMVMVNRQTGIGGTVTGVGWDHGETLWLRWVERNDDGSDHGLAIDNFSFSVTAVPEARAYVLGTAICCLALLVAIIRRRIALTRCLCKRASENHAVAEYSGRLPFLTSSFFQMALRRRQPLNNKTERECSLNSLTFDDRRLIIDAHCWSTPVSSVSQRSCVEIRKHRLINATAPTEISLKAECIMRSFVLAAICFVLVSADRLRADIVYATPGSSYTQDFDALEDSTSTGNAWTNDSTITGWHLYNSTNAAITTYNAGTGSSATGSFYSFGALDTPERALGGVGAGTAYFGSPASGDIAGYIAANVTNSTGSTLVEFTLTYDGEQWRKSGVTTAHTMVFEYGFGSTFAGVSTWIAPGGNFDWATPAITSGAGAIDGNTTGLVSGRGGTVPGLNWTNGSTLWLRWIERNDVNDDHGLAIDEVSFSAAVPEPGAALFAGLVCSVMGLTAAARRLFRKAF